MTPTLISIDLSKRNDCFHPYIKKNKQYLAKVGKSYYAGYFTDEWYGWNFSCGYGAGIQLDDPDWRGLWEIC